MVDQFVIHIFSNLCCQYKELLRNSSLRKLFEYKLCGFTVDDIDYYVFMMLAYGVTPMVVRIHPDLHILY
ncbi:hypothetical protein VNO80_09417 [Phaseolus coccineus]|uniref:Uncharacterized protein n=1 Tax=Phaseolus coccineus TaxID=3886 RepID=A0AAN9N6F8_PHACN